jgi:hypothetical protein
MGNPGVTEEGHRSDFTGNDKVLGNCSRVWYTCHHLEAIPHRNEESTVKPAFSEFSQVDYIVRASLDGLRRKSA